MRALVTATLSAMSLLLAAGCQSTPEEQSPAKAEDRKPGGSGAKPGAEARRVERPKIAATT